MRLVAVLAVIFSIMPLSAYAAEALKEPAKPVVLQNLEKQGVALRYLGNDNGVDGWIGFQGGQEQFFYATPDGQAIISGIMMNSKGDIVTMRQLQDLRKRDPGVDKLSETPGDAAPAAAPPVAAPAVAVAPASAPVAAAPSKSQQLWADIESSGWVALGNKDAPVIYTIIDPECPHCHDMLQDIRKSGDLEKGLVQIRVIPVGLIGPQSLTEAANLLSVPDAKTALYKHLDGDKAALAVNPSADPHKVQGNMVLMQNWKIDVTPFSIYKSKTGDIKILRGRPKNLAAVVADLK